MSVSFAPETKGEPGLPSAQYSSAVAKAVRAVFAAYMWHMGIMTDAIALATHLKFNPKYARPEVATKDSTSAAVQAFAEPPPPLSNLAEGSPVLVMLKGSPLAVPATVKQVMVARRAEVVELEEGMRLEAKDRKNPGLVCELFVSL